MMWKLLVLVAGCVQDACAYPRSAPAKICGSMFPGHRATPQTGASPYSIQAPAKKCDKDVTVTLTGGTFKGFICQPRKDVNVAQTSGTLTPMATQASLVQNNCDTLTSLSHTSNETKSSLQFKWAPVGNETVYIVCSFVQNYNTFWVKQSSGAVTLNPADPSCQSRASPMAPALPSALALVILVVTWFLKDV